MEPTQYTPLEEILLDHEVCDPRNHRDLIFLWGWKWGPLTKRTWLKEAYPYAILATVLAPVLMELKQYLAIPLLYLVAYSIHQTNIKNNILERYHWLRFEVKENMKLKGRVKKQINPDLLSQFKNCI